MTTTTPGGTTGTATDASTNASANASDPYSGRRPSRVLRRTPLAWDVSGLAATGRDKSDETRFPDFVLFAALAFPALVAPVIGLPVNELAMGLMCLVALTRVPATGFPLPPWFVAGVLALIGFLYFTSLDHHLYDLRRLLHLGLYGVLVLVVASGRVHLLSAARGLALALPVSFALAVAGVADAGYAGRLSGWIGDPNSAGFTMTVLGAAAIGLLGTSRLRLVLLAVIPLTVLLTYSRTSLLALALSIVWLLLGRRVGPVVGLALVGLGIYLVSHIPHELRLFGPFSDRSGSDALRERIIAQENLDISRSPLLGSGAGSARVEVAGNTFYYHSSYFGLDREGGLVAVGLLILLVTAVAVATIRRPAAERNPWFEVSLICVMVCAVNLGEVLLELPTAIALGVLAHALTRRSAEPDVTLRIAPEVAR